MHLPVSLPLIIRSRQSHPVNPFDRLRTSLAFMQVQQAAKRTVMHLNNTIMPDAAIDAALLFRVHPAAGFDCWWHITVKCDSQPLAEQSHWR